MAATMGTNAYSIEVHFAQHLASNEKLIRDRAVKKVSKWLNARSKKDSGFDKEEMLKLWKGLFYCMWMCDKPLTQEDLADEISQMIHSLHTAEQGLLFFEVMLETMAREWIGIDHHRVNKFLMLIRRCFREALVTLKKNGWKEEMVTALCGILTSHVLNPREGSCPNEIRYFFVDIFMDEFSRVGGGELSADQVVRFLKMFADCVCLTKINVLSKNIMKTIFDEIVNQAAVGEDNGEDLQIFEEKNEKAEVEGVKVFEELPMPEFDYSAIADMLFKCASSQKTLPRNRKLIYPMVQSFQDLARGVFPEDDIILKNEVVDKFLLYDKPGIAKKRERRRRQFKAKLERRKQRAKERRLLAQKMQDISGTVTDDQAMIGQVEGGSVANSATENCSSGVEVGVKESISEKELSKVNAGKQNEHIKTKTKSKKSRNKKKKETNLDGNSGQIQKDKVFSTPERKEAEHGSGRLTKRKSSEQETELESVEGKTEEVDDNSHILKYTPPVTRKRVKIALAQNQVNPYTNYAQRIMESPSIPFDGNKQPTQGVLKAPSPTKPRPTRITRSQTKRINQRRK